MLTLLPHELTEDRRAYLFYHNGVVEVMGGGWWSCQVEVVVGKRVMVVGVG
jgi:hypothetical protein